MAPDLNSLPKSAVSTVSDYHTPNPVSLGDAIVSSAEASEPDREDLSIISRGEFQQRHMSQLSQSTPSTSIPPALNERDTSTDMNSSNSRLSHRSLSSSIPALAHQRQASLGDLHQELENEQEAQVNRLLQMIRTQQSQLAAILRQQQQRSQLNEQDPALSTHGRPSAPGVIDGQQSGSTDLSSYSRIPAGLASPGLSRSLSATVVTQPLTSLPHSTNTEASTQHPLSSQSSWASNSANASVEQPIASTRDESVYYQAETHMLRRENQMLKLRIRELERQVAESENGPPGEAQSSASRVQILSPSESRTAVFSGESVPPVLVETDVIGQPD